MHVHCTESGIGTGFPTRGREGVILKMNKSLYFNSIQLNEQIQFLTH